MYLSQFLFDTRNEGVHGIIRGRKHGNHSKVFRKLIKDEDSEEPITEVRS